MKTSVTVVASSLLALILGVGASPPKRFVANRFIVELDPDATAIEYGKRSPNSAHVEFYSFLRRREVGFTVDREFNAEGLFVGAAVTLNSAEDFNSLASTPGVRAVRPVVRVAAPNPIKVLVGQPSHAGTSQPIDTESTHVITGVDKVHAMGITGKGIKIGIIDTGIDYTHPDLGGGIGPGHKVIGGFDFVGDAYNGSNTPVPDPDPLDQCNGHGTHVGGIIGANPGNQFNISGVAYDASITAYRIFGCSGDTTDDVIVEALLRGVSDGQDILTMSLGGADGWTEGTSSVVSSRIAATGKVVTIAAGNDGSVGAWYTSSPGNAIDAISVASLDNTVIPLQNATVHGVVHDPIPYFALFPFPTTATLPIFATSTNTSIVDDACDPLPASTPDLSGFLTIIRRGTCTFVQKLTNAAAFGANFALIYDDGVDFASIDTGNFTNATLIQEADGIFLVTQFASGAPISLSFPQTGALFNFPDPTALLISSFSSYGPTNDMFFKPAVAAPGGNILSTFPVPLGSFAVLSGTSMATPFVAGSAALVFEGRGTGAGVGVGVGVRGVFESTARVVSTSNSLGGEGGEGALLQTVAQQGAGLVDVFKAVTGETVVTPAELLLNDTANFKGTHTIHFTNTGSSTKVYTLSHVPAGTAETIAEGDILANAGPVPLTSSFATLTFSSNHITVHPGQTGSVTITVHPPPASLTFPVYSGFVVLADNTGAETHVSYLGVAGALKGKAVLDRTEEAFGFQIPAVVDGNLNPVEPGTNFTFVGGDFPTLLLRLAFGTAKLTVDLVSPDEEVPAAGTFEGVRTLGLLVEQDYIPRSSNELDLADNGFTTFALDPPIFANGTAIPDGAYRALVRALRVTGDAAEEGDYEAVLTGVFGFEVNGSG